MTHSKRWMSLLLAVLMLLTVPTYALATGGNDGGSAGGGEPQPEAIAITVKAKAVQKIFDGTPLLPEVEIEPAEGLQAGHKIASATFVRQDNNEVISNGKLYYSATPVYVKVTEVRIEDEDGTDVTNQYDITYPDTDAFAPMTILKCALQIKVLDDTKVYDGDPLNESEIEVTGLVDGYTVEIESFMGEITDVGTTPITTSANQVVVKDSNGVDRTKNFAIADETIVPGTLRITPAKVTLTSEGEEKVYDGTPLTKAGVTVGGAGKALFEEQQETFTAAATGTLTNVGWVTNTIDYTLTMKDGFSKDNFDIQKDEGTLEITARPIKVKPVDVSVPYDGAEHKATMVEPAADSPNNLVDGHEFEVPADAFTGSQTAVGSSDSSINSDMIRIMSGETDVTANYAITAATGKIVVTAAAPAKIPATLTVEDVTKVYDGTALDASKDIPAANIKLTGLEEGHTFTTSFSGSITDVGKEPIVLASLVIKDGTGNGVTDQYEVTEKLGNLIVEKATVTLTSAGGTQVYNGQALKSETVTVGGNGAEVFKTEVTNIKATGSVTHVSEGEVKNAITYTAGESFDAGNYNEITKIEGKLKVTARPVTVTSASLEKKYDGTALTNGTNPPQITSGSFVNGDTVECEFTGSQTNVEKPEKIEDNTFDYTFKAGANSTSEETDYDITAKCGTLKITPRSIVLTSGSSKKTYDGKKLVNTEVKVTGDGLVTGDKIEYFDFSSKTNVGKCDNEFQYKFADSVDANNYTVKQVYGELKVSASGSSTQTGVQDNWPMLLGGSAVLAAAGIALLLILKKKNRSNG